MSIRQVEGDFLICLVHLDRTWACLVQYLLSFLSASPLSVMKPPAQSLFISGINIRNATYLQIEAPFSKRNYFSRKSGSLLLFAYAFVLFFSSFRSLRDRDALSFSFWIHTHTHTHIHSHIYVYTHTQTHRAYGSSQGRGQIGAAAEAYTRSKLSLEPLPQLAATLNS